MKRMSDHLEVWSGVSDEIWFCVRHTEQPPFRQTDCFVLVLSLAPDTRQKFFKCLSKEVDELSWLQSPWCFVFLSPHRTAHETLCVTCSVFIVSQHTFPTFGSWIVVVTWVSISLCISHRVLAPSMTDYQSQTDCQHLWLKHPPGDFHTITYLVGVLALFGFM